MSKSVRSALILVAAIVATLVSSCGGDEEDAKGRFTEPCTIAQDCQEGLVCPAGFCTTSCTTPDTSTCLTYSNRPNVCSGGTCYITCSGGPDDCPADLRCHMAGSASGTCRP